MPRSALWIIPQPFVNPNWCYSLETPISGQKRWFFCPAWPWDLTDDLEKQQGPSPNPLQTLCIIPKPSVNWNWSCGPETPDSPNRRFFVPCDLEISRMTLKNTSPMPHKHHFIAICKFKLVLQSGNGLIGWPWRLTSNLDLLYGHHVCQWW